jgi:alanine racemase
VEIDLSAIASNVRNLAKVAAPAGLCIVVKADAYGHGDIPVAETALSEGADYLAVALVEEGARLREAGIDAPILLLSEPGADGVADVLRWQLTPTVYTDAFLRRLVAEAEGRYPVHVKVDTGMHRVGADPEVAFELAKRVVAAGSLRLEGVWTHFAVADIDPDFTSTQIERFRAFVAALADRGIEPEVIHAANTPATLLHPEAHFDMVRTGLGVYGLRPTPDVAPHVELHPAMRVISAVALVRPYPKDTRLSYGRRRALPRDGWVATVPVGYADGISGRYADVGGEVLIGGERRPLAGTVTMDQIVVDLGPEPVEVGTEVVLMGSQGSDAITADEWAERLGTINYEIVCRIGPRMPRRYRQ